MLVPLIMAIWFGYTAHQAGKSWLGWAVGGALLAFLISTVTVNLAAVLFGPFTIDSYIPFRIVSALVAIAITVLVGRALMSRVKAGGGGPAEPTGSSGGESGPGTP